MTGRWTLLLAVEELAAVAAAEFLFLNKLCTLTFPFGSDIKLFAGTLAEAVAYFTVFLNFSSFGLQKFRSRLLALLPVSVEVLLDCAAT